MLQDCCMEHGRKRAEECMGRRHLTRRLLKKLMVHQDDNKFLVNVNASGAPAMERLLQPPPDGGAANRFFKE
eukprot:jgi/Mesen1/8176/ME000044S07442